MPKFKIGDRVRLKREWLDPAKHPEEAWGVIFQKHLSGVGIVLRELDEYTNTVRVKWPTQDSTISLVFPEDLEYDKDEFEQWIEELQCRTSLNLGT